MSSRSTAIAACQRDFERVMCEEIDQQRNECVELVENMRDALMRQHTLVEDLVTNEFQQDYNR